jgi:hypothetical protein
MTAISRDEFLLQHSSDVYAVRATKNGNAPVMSEVIL